MSVEIERKYLLTNSEWLSEVASKTEIKQGYLNSHVERTVRVRIAGAVGIITIKGKNVGVTRAEFEYEIPLVDAQQLMALCEQPIIEKTRYLVHQNELTWEIDAFEGANKGLIVAEIELESEEQKVTLPSWIGKEVSNDPKYYNSSLISNPFSNWNKDQ